MWQPHIDAQRQKGLGNWAQSDALAWPTGGNLPHGFFTILRCSCNAVMQEENEEPCSVLWGCAVLGPLRSLSQPWAVPGSPGTEPPLIALPQTPRLTLKLSWLRPHRGSIPGLDSPAAPCRWSNTSLRWPGVHTARNPPKPELRPTPHPTARPRLSHGLSAPASPSQKGPSSLHLPPAKCPSPRPPWSRPKCVCVCMRGSRGRGGSD